MVSRQRQKSEMARLTTKIFRAVLSRGDQVNICPSKDKLYQVKHLNVKFLAGFIVYLIFFPSTAQ